MTLENLLDALDDLTPEDLETVYQHIVQRRHTPYWLVPGTALKEIPGIMQPVYVQTDMMSEEDVNAVIDEALDEVRREQKTRRGD